MGFVEGMLDFDVEEIDLFAGEAGIVSGVMDCVGCERGFVVGEMSCGEGGVGYSFWGISLRSFLVFVCLDSTGVGGGATDSGALDFCATSTSGVDAAGVGAVGFGAVVVDTSGIDLIEVDAVVVGILGVGVVWVSEV